MFIAYEPVLGVMLPVLDPLTVFRSPLKLPAPRVDVTVVIGSVAVVPVAAPLNIFVRLDVVVAIGAVAVVIVPNRLERST